MIFYIWLICFDSYLSEIIELKNNCYNREVGVGGLHRYRCIVCRMFCVLKNIVKKIDVNVFSKTLPKLRMKHDVLHDVLGFRNSIQKYDKSLVILP